MKNGKKLSVLLLSLSLIFALLSMPVSGALNGMVINRAASAWVSGNNQTLLILNGFEGQSYNLNNSYNNFGTITNNTDKNITLYITVDVDFGNIINKNIMLGFKAGNQAMEIQNNGDTSKELTITLLPRQTLNIMAFMDRSQNKLVEASFTFKAEDADGNFMMQLEDSADYPRRIYCY